MKSPTIIVDSDAILADLLGPWLGLYNTQFGDALTKSDIVDWEIHKLMRRCSRPQVYALLDTPNLFSILPPIPGARLALDTLRSMGCEVICATASATAPSTAADKIEWLRRVMGFKKRETFVGAKKHLLRSDLFIDDSPDFIEEYRAAWPDAKIATIAYPYNRPAWEKCDLVASHYLDTEQAWWQIVGWVRAGMPPQLIDPKQNYLETR